MNDINNNAKIVVLIAVVALGSIILFGGSSNKVTDNGNNDSGNNDSTDYTKRAAELAKALDDLPNDRGYSDTDCYVRVWKNSVEYTDYNARLYGKYTFTASGEKIYRDGGDTYIDIRKVDHWETIDLATDEQKARAVELAKVFNQLPKGTALDYGKYYVRVYTSETEYFDYKDFLYGGKAYTAQGTKIMEGGSAFISDITKVLRWEKVGF